MGTRCVQTNHRQRGHRLNPFPEAIIAYFEAMGREKATRDKQTFSVNASNFVSCNASDCRVAFCVWNQSHGVPIEPLV